MKTRLKLIAGQDDLAGKLILSQSNLANQVLNLKGHCPMNHPYFEHCCRIPAWQLSGPDDSHNFIIAIIIIS